MLLQMTDWVRSGLMPTQIPSSRRFMALPTTSTGPSKVNPCKPVRSTEMHGCNCRLRPFSWTISDHAPASIASTSMFHAGREPPLESLQRLLDYPPTDFAAHIRDRVQRPNGDSSPEGPTLMVNRHIREYPVSNVGRSGNNAATCSRGTRR